MAKLHLKQYMGSSVSVKTYPINWLYCNLKIRHSRAWNTIKCSSFIMYVCIQISLGRKIRKTLNLHPKISNDILHTLLYTFSWYKQGEFILWSKLLKLVILLFILMILITLWLPWVTKTEFLLTISITCEPD